MDQDQRKYKKLDEEEIEDERKDEEAIEPMTVPEQDSDAFEYDSSTEILSLHERAGGTETTGPFLTPLIVSHKKTWRILCPTLADFFSSYRSADPQSRVAPFAVVLLLVLLVIYIVNQADKLVLAVLIPAGLQCSNNVTSNNTCGVATNLTSLNTSGEDCIAFDDNQQGLLTGPAFTVIYVLAGLPLAWLADTASRSLVLLIGLSFWSVMVFLTGFVEAFWELLVLRMMLGIGEVSGWSRVCCIHPWQSRVDDVND